MKTYLKNVAITSVLVGKCLVILAVIGAVFSVMVLPAVWIGEHTHWAMGLAYGVGAMILIIAGIGTLLDKVKSDSPIADWMDRLPFDEGEQ